jgi:hypothetical protein
MKIRNRPPHSMTGSCDTHDFRSRVTMSYRHIWSILLPPPPEPILSLDEHLLCSLSKSWTSRNHVVKLLQLHSRSLILQRYTFTTS